MKSLKAPGRVEPRPNTRPGMGRPVIIFTLVRSLVEILEEIRNAKADVRTWCVSAKSGSPCDTGKRVAVPGKN